MSEFDKVIMKILIIGFLGILSIVGLDLYEERLETKIELTEKEIIDFEVQRKTKNRLFSWDEDFVHLDFGNGKVEVIKEPHLLMVKRGEKNNFVLEEEMIVTSGFIFAEGDVLVGKRILELDEEMFNRFQSEYVSVFNETPNKIEEQSSQ